MGWGDLRLGKIDPPASIFGEFAA